MSVLYTNNASATLSASITNAATSFSVSAGQGALFPAITGSDFFYVTLTNTAGTVEIVKVTARSTDTFTVVRGQDGTSAVAWSSGDKVELRVTKAMLDQFKTDTQAGITSSNVTTALGYTPQSQLVSGTNIKTINSQSLLGSGDIVISGGGGSSALTIDNKTAAYTVVAGDLGKIINFTSGTFTISLTAAATLGAGFNCWIWNTSATSSDVVTIDPNLSETIDEKITLAVYAGEGLQIICDGTNWQTGDKKAMRGYAESIAVTGLQPVARGNYSVAIGANVSATGATSYAFGRYAVASNSYSLAIGNYYGSTATASGSGAIAIGSSTTASGTAAQTFGLNTTAASNYSTAIGLGSAGTNGAQAVTGAGAMALGGSYASGTDSFAAAIANNTSTYGATGANSVALGQQVKASGAQSYAIGRLGIASGINSTVLGGLQSEAAGDNSVTLGSAAKASQYGKQAFASYFFASAGDAQAGKLVLRRQTTDATATVLTSNNSAAGTTNQVILPNDSTFAFTILVVARRTDADNESAGYKFEGVIDRNGSAATTAIVGTVVKTVLAEDSTAWDCSVTADTTNGGLAITVTGEAAKTIRWVATVWTSEVTG